MFFNSQNIYEVGSSSMGLKQIQKWEFEVKSTCTNQENSD
jgi:hypothetical protein